MAEENRQNEKAKNENGRDEAGKTESVREKSLAIRVIRFAVDLCAVLALLALAAGTFRHVQKAYFPEDMSAQKAGEPGDFEQSADEAGGSVGAMTADASAQAPTGTWCTLKSNSLDGVPIYPQAGETFQAGLIPEGKCCELLATQVYENVTWAQISYCGQTGWLELERLHFISTDASYIKPGDVVYLNALTEKGVSGYKEPSASAEKVVDGITYGVELEVLELKNGWGLVRAGGREFWINMYFVGSYPVNSWRVETLSSAAEINLREQPDEEAKSLCKVPEDTALTIEEFRNGWGRIRYDGQEGWVMLHYLTPVEEQ